MYMYNIHNSPYTHLTEHDLNGFRKSPCTPPDTDISTNKKEENPLLLGFFAGIIYIVDSNTMILLVIPVRFDVLVPKPFVLLVIPVIYG